MATTNTKTVNTSGVTYDSTTNVAQNWIEVAPAGANIFAIQDNTLSASIKVLGTGDTIYIEGNFADYQFKQNGKTITMDNGIARVAVTLSSMTTKVQVTTTLVFLDGSVTLTNKAGGVKVSMNGLDDNDNARSQLLTTKYADVKINADDSNTAAATYFTTTEDAALVDQQNQVLFTAALKVYEAAHAETQVARAAAIEADNKYDLLAAAVTDAQTASVAEAQAGISIEASLRFEAAAANELLVAAELESVAALTTSTVDNALAVVATNQANAAVEESALATEYAIINEVAAEAVVAGYADLATTFALTTSVDTIVGEADTNIAVTGTGTTFTAYDSIKSTGTASTLTITDTTGAAASGIPAGVSVSGIQTATINSSGTIGASGVTTAATNETETVTFQALGAGETVIIASRTVTAGAAGATAADVATAFASGTTTAVGGATPSGTIASYASSAATGTFGNVVTLTSTTAGNVANLIVTGTAVTGIAAVNQASGLTVTLNTTNVTDLITFTYNGITLTTLGAGATVATAATAIVAAINNYAGSTIASSTGLSGVVSISAPYVVNVANFAGTGATFTTVTTTASYHAAIPAAAPTVVVVDGAAASTTSVVVTNVSGFTGLTQFTGTSVGGANLKAATTTNVTEANTGGGLVSVSGALAATVNNTDSVDVLGAKGAVNVTIATAKPITLGSNGAAGVLVTGGTTVSVTEAAATVSGTTGSTLSNGTAIVIGAAPSAVSGQTATGYPQVIAGLSSDPTGYVTTNVSTSWTNASGLVDVIFGTGTVAAYTNGATTVSVKGSGGATIADVQTTLLLASATATAAAGTSTLTTVNLAGMSGASTVKSNAIANLSITDSSNGNVTISGSSATTSNTGTLNLSIGNSTATVATPNNTVIAVTAVNSNYGAIAGTAVGATSPSALTLTAAKATSLSFAGTSALTLAASTLTALATITDTSAGALKLGDVSSYSNLGVINAATATGALTATIGGTGTTVGMALTGGAGNDVITLKDSGSFTTGATASGGTVTTSLNLGAGDDAVYVQTGTGASVGVGTVINAGTGTADTLSALLITGGNAGIFTGFEVLDTTYYASSLTATLLTNSTITGLAYHGANGTSIPATTNTANIGSLALNSTINVTGFTDQTAAAGYLQNITQTHVTGAATTAVTFAASPTVDATNLAQSLIGTLTSTGDTSISIVSGGGTFLDNNGINTIAETGNTLTSITISGAKAFTLGAVTEVASTTTATNTALTLIDGSTATGVLTITAGGTSATYNTYTGLTIKGGSGNDVINTSASNGVVIGGAGNDSIIVGTQVSTFLTGGSGADNFNVALAVINNGAASNTITTSITDIASLDKITLADDATGNSFASGKINVNSATTLAQAIDAAATFAGATADTSVTQWMQFAGNTYIVQNLLASGNTAATDLNTGAVVVALTGLVDLSTASFDATSAFLTLA